MADGWQPRGSGPRYRLRQAVDALVYGAVITLVVAVAGSVASFSLGGGWFGVELTLFLVGAALLAYGAFQLRPAKRWDVEFDDDGFRVVRPGGESRVVGSCEETRFQAAVQRVPPLSRLGLPPEDRLSPATKLFVAAVVMLLASIVLEAVLFW